MVIGNSLLALAFAALALGAWLLALGSWLLNYSVIPTAAE